MNDNTKFLLACCAFSFITGAFVAVLISTHRDIDRPCAVSVRNGQITHVSVGHYE